MEDLPNSWGEPDDKMQAEAEYTLREMLKGTITILPFSIMCFLMKPGD
jgi:hypothetical protein